MGAYLHDERAHSAHPALPSDLIRRLRDGIATCRSTASISPEARTVIIELCNVARNKAWPAEALIIAVREACHASPEIMQLTTTSEREAMLATLVSGCISEFYQPSMAD